MLQSDFKALVATWTLKNKLSSPHIMFGSPDERVTSGIITNTFFWLIFFCQYQINYNKYIPGHKSCLKFISWNVCINQRWECSSFQQISSFCAKNYQNKVFWILEWVGVLLFFQTCYSHPLSTLRYAPLVYESCSLDKCFLWITGLSPNSRTEGL